MKCPHCKTEIDTDVNSPQALLRHLDNNLRITGDDLRERKKIHPKGQFARKEKNHAKWKAWRNWVQLKLDKEQ